MAVTIPQGKTVDRYARLLLNGHNISGDARSVSAGTTKDLANVTGWSDDLHQFIGSRGTVNFDNLTVLFNNAVAATGPAFQGSHTTLKTFGSYHVGLFLGIRAAPSIGVPAFSSSLGQGSYYVDGTDSPVMANGSFYGDAVVDNDIHVWGQALAVGTELTATGALGSVDNGASTANGYIAYLFIPQTTAAIGSNNWSFVIQHSSNDSSWSTLATFTANGSSITAERLTATGTVNRYVRLLPTRTAGTANPWVNFIRL